MADPANNSYKTSGTYQPAQPMVTPTPTPRPAPRQSPTPTGGSVHGNNSGGNGGARGPQPAQTPQNYPKNSIYRDENGKKYTWVTVPERKGKSYPYAGYDWDKHRFLYIDTDMPPTTKPEDKIKVAGIHAEHTENRTTTDGDYIDPMKSKSKEEWDSKWTKPSPTASPSPDPSPSQQTPSPSPSPSASPAPSPTPTPPATQPKSSPAAPLTAGYANDAVDAYDLGNNSGGSGASQQGQSPGSYADAGSQSSAQTSHDLWSGGDVLTQQIPSRWQGGGADNSSSGDGDSPQSYYMT